MSAFIDRQRGCAPARPTPSLSAGFGTPVPGSAATETGEFRAGLYYVASDLLELAKRAPGDQGEKLRALSAAVMSLTAR